MTDLCNYLYALGEKKNKGMINVKKTFDLLYQDI